MLSYPLPAHFLFSLLHSLTLYLLPLIKKEQAELEAEGIRLKKEQAELEAEGIRLKKEQAELEVSVSILL
jgi:hypothetical protein